MTISKDELKQYHEQTEHIEKIKQDLIEIQAVIAKKDIIPDCDEMENQEYSRNIKIDWLRIKSQI